MNALWQLLQLVQQRQIMIVLGVGVTLGLLLGLAIGYWWWPVEWSNAAPNHLRLDFQNQYLIWVARQHESSNDSQWAHDMLGVQYWAQTPIDTKLSELAQQCQGGQLQECDAEDARRLQNLAEGLTTVSTEPQAAGGIDFRAIAMVCGAGTIVVALVGAVLFLISRRQAGSGPRPEARDVGIADEFAPAERVSWGIEGPPLAQFVTTYTLGDDHYDPSFSIELDNSEFMGECGVGISETIGVGAPSKVTACEVWLFDKNDIRTVTMVLMSEYAFHDEALRTKLAPKGEPLLAEVGRELVLETKTLRVQARVVEVAYGTGNLPPNSFFERLTVDLAAWAIAVPAESAAEADFPTMQPAL
jgi:hypothetical protein